MSSSGGFSLLDLMIILIFCGRSCGTVEIDKKQMNKLLEEKCINKGLTNEHIDNY